MKGYLLDANVLLALAWPSHVHHSRAQQWLAAQQAKGWATCAVTQLAFVRLSSQPAFSPHHKSPGEAMRLLRQLTSLPTHAYWSEPEDGFAAGEVISVFHRIATHHHVTDGWLVATAMFNEGRLATFDQPLSRLFPKGTVLVE